MGKVHKKPGHQDLASGTSIPLVLHRLKKQPCTLHNQGITLKIIGDFSPMVEWTCVHSLPTYNYDGTEKRRTNPKPHGKHNYKLIKQ